MQLSDYVDTFDQEIPTVSKVFRDFSDITLLRSVIGPENWCHFFLTIYIQNSNSTRVCRSCFSRASDN